MTSVPVLKAALPEVKVWALVPEEYRFKSSDAPPVAMVSIRVIIVVDIASGFGLETGSAAGGFSTDADRRGEEIHKIHAKIGSRGSISADGDGTSAGDDDGGRVALIYQEHGRPMPDAWNVVAKRPAAKINASKPEL